MEQIEACAASIQLTPRQQKAIAIMRATMSAMSRIHLMAPIAFPPKRIFRKKERRPLKRIAKRQAKLSMVFEPYIAASHIMKAMSTPVYQKGGPQISIVGDYGQEVIIQAEGVLKPILPSR